MLARESIARLIENLSPGVRADTAANVAEEFARGRLQPEERRIAEDILEIFAKDIEVKVREAIVAHVSACPFLPAGIASRLAADVESVALPMLRYSEVLGEEDLLAVVQGGSEPRQNAVAERRRVSPPLCEALARLAPQLPLLTLLRNGGAELSEQAYECMLDRYGDDQRLQAGIAARPLLPMAVTARLILYVSEELRARIVARHNFPTELAETLVRHGRERALSGQLSRDRGATEIEALLHELHRQGALTPTLLLRAACEGNLALLEAGLGLLAATPRPSAAILLYDAGPLGLKALYGKARLPQPLYPAFRVAVDQAVLVRRQGRGWRPSDTRAILRHLASEYAHLGPVGLEAVLSQLSHLWDADEPSCRPWRH